MVKLICKEVIQQLSEYLDGELDAALVHDLARHLEGCRHCRVVVSTTRRTIEIFCNCRPAPLPSDVSRRLRQVLARQYR
ncbi:MAG TPA: zf-HC2 domain-containing protein [Terriglobia bacterium]|nr:zf-HC2 domain-containing protein [Terriglobia bacterium]